LLISSLLPLLHGWGSDFNPEIQTFVKQIRDERGKAEREKMGQDQILL
jgi:hypothetical protein